MEYWSVVISLISQLNRTLAEYLAQNGWYLFYYFNFHNITDTLLWPVTMLVITVKHTPMPFWICEMEQWCIAFPVPHTYSKSKIWVKVGIDVKSTKRETHVLVTPIVHLSTSYDNSHYFCNKLHLWIPTLKNEQPGADHLIIAPMTVISWFEIGCFIRGNSLPIRTFASTCGGQVPLLPWAAQGSATLAATVLHNVFTCSWYRW